MIYPLPAALICDSLGITLDEIKADTTILP